ncbi:S-layer homology domain-containing protein [Paenibacillus guangzhouensis]|uniref:S-layer homology domain-containing protein n=1 Tax=Paenibacillus guangzhouensis TaxID=1473112 RepID=UPI00126694EE|nr:S-layer homology domain-containing protein [Paenibacillus guangzhouensis]
MKKVLLSAISAATLLAGALTIVPTNAEAGVVDGAKDVLNTTKTTVSSLIQKFKDLPATHWAASAIQSAVNNGYFKGYSDGSFKPNAPVTKAEMATILGRISEQPVITEYNANFTDLPAWATESVKAAVEKGFIDPSKYSGKLDANAALTRGEMAIWLAQGLAVVNSEYKVALSDVTNTVIPAKEYFTGKLPETQKNSVAVTMGTGLMSVGSDENFGTDRTTTRAEVATLIARYTAVAKKQPDDFKGLQELRAVGLTGTNLKVIAPTYEKWPKERLPESYDYSKITDDFSKVRNKELVTRADYATAKVKNWIVVSPYAKGDQRSIYYPVFLDEGATASNGSFYSFAEFDMKIKGDSMSQTQAGNLFNAPAIDPLKSPSSKAYKDYSLPHTNDITKSRGVFTVKNPHYWGIGLLRFDDIFFSEVQLKAKDGTEYYVAQKK